MELQQILEEEFFYDASIEEANEIATSLVQLVEALKEIDSNPYGETGNSG